MNKRLSLSTLNYFIATLPSSDFNKQKSFPWCEKNAPFPTPPRSPQKDDHIFF